MNTNKHLKLYLLPILLIGILVALDQVTKQMIQGSFVLYETRPVIENIFHLTYIQNTGIAWGMFQGGRTILLILTILILLICACLYAKIPADKRFLPMRGCLIFLISGAIGNMIDRIHLHYVVDFFDFRLINFPVFNVADIYVTCSMILLLILCLFYYKEDEIDAILSFHKTQEPEIEDSISDSVNNEIEHEDSVSDSVSDSVNNETELEVSLSDSVNNKTELEVSVSDTVNNEMELEVSVSDTVNNEMELEK